MAMRRCSYMAAYTLKDIMMSSYFSFYYVIVRDTPTAACHGVADVRSK